MGKLKPESIIEFYAYIAKLKELPRTGWVRRGVRNPESVAAHSYGVAVLSFMMASDAGADAGRALKLALVHDLAEALAGDITPHDKAYKSKRQIEEDKLAEIVACLPLPMRQEIIALFAELNAGKTAESGIVRTADKLDMALMAKSYGKKIGNVDEFLDSAAEGISGCGRDIVEHLKGRFKRK